MKKLFISLLIVAAYNCSAQPKTVAIDIEKADSVVLGKAQLDFAVPDIPAFKAIGADPSSILRLPL